MWCAVEGLGGEASSEAEITLRVRGGPQMGRTAKLGRRLSEDWASLGPGKDPGAVGELKELHGIWVQSDDGVVIIGGFFLSLGLPSSSPSSPSDRRKTVSLGSV